MSLASKSITNPTKLGNEIRNRRKRLDLTLENLSNHTHVNVGQLSRFERGNMKLMSKNLQKIFDFLQIYEDTINSKQPLDVVSRFSIIIQRSKRHAQVATAFVEALESLK
jgi:transcriptional regulator with XRE-family HTH domain